MRKLIELKPANRLRQAIDKYFEYEIIILAVFAYLSLL